MFFSLLADQQSPDVLTWLKQSGPMFLAIAGVFYFLLIRPAQKQKQKQQQLLNELKSGDMVLTNSGIKGTVTSVDGETIVVRVRPDNVKLEFARSAVSTLISPDAAK